MALDSSPPRSQLPDSLFLEDAFCFVEQMPIPAKKYTRRNVRLWCAILVEVGIVEIRPIGERSRRYLLYVSAFCSITLITGPRCRVPQDAGIEQGLVGFVRIHSLAANLLLNLRSGFLSSRSRPFQRQPSVSFRIMRALEILLSRRTEQLLDDFEGSRVIVHHQPMP